MPNFKPKLHKLFTPFVSDHKTELWLTLCVIDSTLAYEAVNQELWWYKILKLVLTLEMIQNPVDRK